MDKNHFNPVSIFFHWITFCVVIAIFLSVEIAISFERGSATRDLFSQIHFYFGATLFVLTLFRLLVRGFKRKPAIDPEPSPTQAWLSRLVHVALYVLMLLIPIAGLALLNSTGGQLVILGQELPAIIDTNRALTATIRERHALLGFSLLTLIAVHAAAALFHHYVIKDNTLNRMMPKPKTTSAQPKAGPTTNES
ncbi:cytochrome b [Photobacterium satsumensis]|uniref:cytochrome b n=1 Tax=Photobacterium satsumensis TaxID=2910239 RepID=UPI003D0E4EFC